MPSSPRVSCRAVRPPRRGVAVKMAPLSVITAAGVPQRVKAPRKVCITSGPVMVGRARLARARREWSSSRLRISAWVPSARCQWVASACQSSLGWSATKRFQAERGRLWGWGVTNPRLCRMRQIVDTARHIRDGGVAGQMFGDGGRAGVVALFGQRLAQPHDAVFDLGADRVSMVVRASGAWLKHHRPAGVVAADQLVYPVPGKPVVAGDLAFAAPFEHDGGDNQLRLRHGRPPTTTE